VRFLLIELLATFGRSYRDIRAIATAGEVYAYLGVHARPELLFQIEAYGGNVAIRCPATYARVSCKLALWGMLPRTAVIRSRHGFASFALRLEFRTFSFGTARRGVDTFVAVVVPNFEGLGTIVIEPGGAMDGNDGVRWKTRKHES
jgi:hypothetical protein